MRNPNLNKRSRRLAYLLRHDDSYRFDEHGYRDVVDLVTNHDFTFPLLEAIVAENDKQRYEFNDDKTKIRARQGHSIDVDVELTPACPPDILFHGTAKEALPSILNEGITRQSRRDVHLSPYEATAMKVGSRHGSPIVLRVDCKRMAEDGIQFFLSRNGVWLTEYVHPRYILE